MPNPLNPGDLDRVLKSLVDVTKVFEATIQNLNKSMADLGVLMKDNVKVLETFADKAADAVDSSDKLMGNIKEVVKALKSVGQPGGIFNSSNNKETIKDLEKMIASVKALQRQEVGGKGTAQFDKSLRDLLAMLKAVKVSGVGLTDEMKKALKEMGYSLDAITQKFSRMPGMIHSIGSALKEAFSQMGTLGPLMAPFERWNNGRQGLSYFKRRQHYMVVLSEPFWVS
jgi:hypothetical protein